jgi:hypothetical protein
MVCNLQITLVKLTGRTVTVGPGQGAEEGPDCCPQSLEGFWLKYVGLFWVVQRTKPVLSRVWGCRPVILALRKLRQENHKFKVSLGYVVRSCLKKKKDKSVKREEVKKKSSFSPEEERVSK